jgi:hypothetical protein
MPSTLRVRARGTALVCRLESMNASPRHFIGREWIETDGVHALHPSDEDSVVANRAEYRQAVKDGSLWAADEDTARACGVAFDPALGDESL